MKGGERGYTLLELLVVMVIFAVVMTLITVSFSRIVRSSSQIIKATESDIGGLIGLELMRTDLELGGFGLYWSLRNGSSLSYSETDDGLELVTSCPGGCPDAKPSRFDDRNYAEANVPSPYRVGNRVGFNGSDYLVVKGTALGESSACRDWCYLNYSSPTIAVVRPSRLEPELSRGDRAIVLKTGAASGGTTRELVTLGGSDAFTARFDEPFPVEFIPKDRSDSFIVYGVAPDNGSLLSFPFNRADYYINRPAEISSVCNKATGVLYKTTINHNGSRTYYPLLDCAADMQVVLFWDSDEDGNIDYHSEVLEEVAGTAAELRRRLKELRVYILAQQGKRDTEYLYPLADPARAVVVGDPALDKAAGAVLGRVWTAPEMAKTFGADWRNYRWKVYSIVVQPKNI